MKTAVNLAVITAICGFVAFAPLNKPTGGTEAADHLPDAAVIAIPAAPPPSPVAGPTTEVAGEGFEFTATADCASGNCGQASGPVRRVAAPVRRTFANRPRLLGRVFGRRR